MSSFENRIAAIEGGISVIACSSGSVAVAMSILNIVLAVDEIISSSALYGGTLNLFGGLRSFGIEVKYVNEAIPDLIKPLIIDSTTATPYIL